MNTKILKLYIINNTHIANAWFLKSTYNLYPIIQCMKLSAFIVLCIQVNLHISYTGTLMIPFYSVKIINTAMKVGKIISSLKILHHKNQC